MQIELIEYRVLEVPDYIPLYVEYDPYGENLHVCWLRDRAEDRDKYSGVTFGAYRRGKFMTGFRQGQIEVWINCARQESATGVPWPHAMFKQIIGRKSELSIYCPSCREDRPWEKRQRTDAPTSKKQSPQLSLF